MTFQKCFFFFFFQCVCVCFFFSQRAGSDITLRLISSAPSEQAGKTSRSRWRSEFPVDFYPDGAEFFWGFFSQRGREVERACRNVALKQLGGDAAEAWRTSASLKTQMQVLKLFQQDGRDGIVSERDGPFKDFF